MRFVLNILLVTFPFFALVLCGYGAARSAMLPQAAIPGLNTFVLYFALPCMLYRFGAGTPIAQLLDASLVLVYLLCALLLVGFTIAVARRAGRGWNDASFGALVAAFPNTGFMGVPLLVALLGAPAAGPVIVTIAVDMLVTSSLCIALSRLDSADEHGAAREARLAAIALGLPLQRFTLTVLVLVAALPSASNVAMLAERFGADNGRIARIILLSTVLAFFSFSAAVAWLA